MMEPISFTNYSWSYRGIDGAVSLRTAPGTCDITE